MNWASSSLLLTLLCLATTSTKVVESNALGNFLMMMGNNKERNNNNMMKNTQNKKQQEAECCEQLEAAESSILLAEQEASKQLEQLREEYDNRIQQLTTASDTSERLKTLQEEFQLQKTEMKTHFTEQTTHLRSLLEQKDAEKIQLQEKLDRTTAEQELVLEQKIQQAAAQWKRGLDVQEMQGDYQRQVDTLEQSTAAAQKELKEQQAAAQAAIQARDIVTGEKKALQKLYDHLERKYEKMITKLDVATEKYIQENFDKVVQEKVEQVNAEWKSKLEELQAESKTLLEEAERRTQQEIEGVRLASEQERSDLREQLAKKIAELAESERMVQDLKARVEKKEEELESTKQSLVKSKQTLAALEGANQKLELTLQSTEKKRKQAVKDAEYWENVFHSRSYLNVSHFQENAVSAIHTAQKTTKEKYDGAKQTAAKYYQEQREVVGKVSEPYVSKSKVVYDAHMRKHVDLAVETARPHVAPLVDKAMQVSREGWALIKDTLDDAYKAIVDQFKTSCSDALKSAKNPDQRKFLKKACRQPEQVVSNTLKVIGVIVLLLCRRLIWKLFVITVRTIWGVIWFFSPVRLLLGLFASKSPPQPPKNQKVNKVSNNAQ